MEPADIANKQFTTVRLREGYDEDEVDTFLDEVEIAFRAVLRRAETAERRLALAGHSSPTVTLPPVPAAPPDNGPSVSSIALLLDNAQKTADQIVVQAKTDAAVIAGNATNEAATVAAQAQVDAGGIVAAAQAKATELADKVTALQTVHSDTIAKLQAALAQLGDQG